MQTLLVELFSDCHINQIEPRDRLSIETVPNNMNILLVGFVKLQLELADNGTYHCVQPRVGHASIYQCHWSGTG